MRRSGARHRRSRPLVALTVLWILALVGPQAPQRATDPWIDLFDRLARLEQTARQSKGFRAEVKSLGAVADERERAGRKGLDFVEKYRARVLQYHLQRLQGLPAKTASEPGVTLDWLPHEAWFATRALMPCAARVDTAIFAFDETPTVEPERAAWLAHVCDEERLALRLDQAERAALGLARRSSDPDDQVRVARLQVERGRGDAARATLTSALEAARDDAVRTRLLVERARAAARLSDERAALADWGAALVQDSNDAALDLARRALTRGQVARAEQLCELALAHAPARDDALALYGRALLPAPIRAQALPGRGETVP